VASADVVNENDALPVVLGIPWWSAVRTACSPSGSVTTVGRALSIEPVLRRQLMARVGTAGQAAMEQLARALRVVQDL
jgi:hypothetical protein